MMVLASTVRFVFADLSARAFETHFSAVRIPPHFFPVFPKVILHAHPPALLLRNWVESRCDCVGPASVRFAHVQLAPLQLLHHLDTLLLPITLLCQFSHSPVLRALPAVEQAFPM